MDSGIGSLRGKGCLDHSHWIFKGMKERDAFNDSGSPLKYRQWMRFCVEHDLVKVDITRVSRQEKQIPDK